MHILLVEDNPGDIRLLQEYLLRESRPSSFHLTHVDRLSSAVAQLANSRFDAVLLDLSLPDSHGINTLVRLHAAARGVPIVVLTSIDDEAMGMELIHVGAQDYLVKGDVTGSLLRRSLRYAVERGRMEAEVREKTRLLQSVLDGVTDGVVMADEHGEFLVWNAAAVLIVGAGPAKVGIGDWAEHYGLFLPDRVTLYPVDQLPLVRAIGGETVYDVLIYRRRLDNSEGGWLSVNAGPLRDETGRIRGGVAVFRDITAQKRTEEALRGSEERFRAIMENSPALIVLKDTEGRYLQVNRKFERVFHIANRDVVGKTDEEIFPLAQAASFRSNDQQVLKAGIPMEFEETALHDDGVHTCLVVKFPLEDPQGQCYALCAIATDITDRKRAEFDRQRLVKDRLLLLESMGEGMYGVDLRGRCTFINHAAARMLGYEPEEVLERPTHEVFHHSRPDGSPYPKEECRVYQSFQRGLGCQVDDEVLWRKDGTSFPVAYSSFPIMEKDIIVGAVVTFTDITDRKRSKEELERTLDQIRTLSRRLETVREEERTRIARELHDELGVRLTCLKMDLSRVCDSSSARSSENIAAMIEQVDTTIAAVQSLAAELRPGVLDDLGLVAAIEWQCRDFERRSGIRCHVECKEEDIPLDAARTTAAFRICQEALTNVLRHARATEIRVVVEKTDGHLSVEIRDNGLGIQAGRATDARSLGLLGMRERAVAVGGSLHIEGTAGQGTLVAFRMPCEDGLTSMDEGAE